MTDVISEWRDHFFDDESQFPLNFTSSPPRPDDQVQRSGSAAATSFASVVLPVRVDPWKLSNPVSAIKLRKLVTNLLGPRPLPAMEAARAAKAQAREQKLPRAQVAESADQLLFEER